MNNAVEEEEDEWDWDDDDEKIETDTSSKKDECAINADNLQNFGFYLGQSGAALRLEMSDLCCFRYQWYRQEHEDTEDREE